MPVFTADTAADSARRSHAPGKRESRAHPLAQIVDMQARLMADVLDPETSTTARAQVARAWKDLEAMKRVIKGQPANTSQSIREPREKKQSKSSAGPLESLPESKPE